MLRSLLVAAFALSALVGCQETRLVFGTTTQLEDQPADGSVSLHVGETIHVVIQGQRTGFMTEALDCTGASVWSTEPWAVKIEQVSADPIYGSSYDVTANFPGDTVINGECAGEQGSFDLHVRP